MGKKRKWNEGDLVTVTLTGRIDCPIEEDREMIVEFKPTDKACAFRGWIPIRMLRPAPKPRRSKKGRR